MQLLIFNGAVNFGDATDKNVVTRYNNERTMQLVRLALLRADPTRMTVTTVALDHSLAARDLSVACWTRNF